jgi:PIN domain nuclease of toxin-antitoxin system
LNHLLDTHAFLWIVANDRRLGSRAKARFLDSGNEFTLSIVSVWEMAIKVSLNKLVIPGKVGTWVRRQLATNRIRLLPLDFEHAARVAELPFHHRDPFDRLLAVQAIGEEIPFLSADRVFDRYGVERIW